jgi:hypothetical protein
VGLEPEKAPPWFTVKKPPVGILIVVSAPNANVQVLAAVVPPMVNCTTFKVPTELAVNVVVTAALEVILTAPSIIPVGTAVMGVATDGLMITVSLAPGVPLGVQFVVVVHNPPPD